MQTKIPVRMHKKMKKMYVLYCVEIENYVVCHSSRDVEDEQHFLFSCPAYSDVRQKHASLFQQASTVSDIFTNSEPNACGGFLREYFSLRKYIVST